VVVSIHSETLFKLVVYTKQDLKDFNTSWGEFDRTRHGLGTGGWVNSVVDTVINFWRPYRNWMDAYQSSCGNRGKQ